MAQAKIMRKGGDGMSAGTRTIDAADGPVVLFGGGGFVGRAVAQELLARGFRLRVAQRAPRLAYAVRALGNLGQTQFAACDISRAGDVARVMAGASAAVNLVGLLRGPMQAVHAGGAGNVARAAADAGLAALVQVSAIGADAASPSAYGRTKAEGEAAVRAAFPAATIVRPSILFGRDDQFTNRFAALIAASPVVPVIRGATKFQPASVADVARAIAIAIAQPGAHGGKTYELGGPDVLSMAEIMRWIAAQTGRTPLFWPMPDALAGLMAGLTGWLPGAPITSDQFRMLGRDNVVAADARGFADFGIRPAPLAALAPAWLSRYRDHGRFGAPART
jgi:NADH dehydrogenase